MSFAALAAIRDVTPPSSSALLLLFVLAEYAGADGSCFPSQETLAERSKLSVRAVRDNMMLLMKAGLISIERRHRKDGTRTSNKVQLIYYTPEEAGPRPIKQRKPRANSAGSQNHQKPNDQRDLLENSHRQISPVVQRQLTPRLPAMVAGLSTFEPVSEPITQDASDFEDFREAVVARKDEAWARSWIDRCGWVSEERLLIPPHRFARARIAQDIGHLLREESVTLGEPEVRGS